MGNDERAPTPDELEQHAGLVADAMKQGAYGVVDRPDLLAERLRQDSTS